MKVTLDKIMSERVEKLALELGISVDELLTNSVNSYINLHQLKNRGYRNIIASGQHKDGDITSWFFNEIEEIPSLIRDGKEKQQANS